MKFLLIWPYLMEFAHEQSNVLDQNFYHQYDWHAIGSDLRLISSWYKQHKVKLLPSQ